MMMLAVAVAACGDGSSPQEATVTPTVSVDPAGAAQSAPLSATGHLNPDFNLYGNDTALAAPASWSAGQPLRLQPTSISASSSMVHWGDGRTTSLEGGWQATSAAPTHTYAAPGTYQITYTVLDASRLPDNAWASSTVTITVTGTSASPPASDSTVSGTSFSSAFTLVLEGQALEPSRRVLTNQLVQVVPTSENALKSVVRWGDGTQSIIDGGWRRNTPPELTSKRYERPGRYPLLYAWQSASGLWAITGLDLTVEPTPPPPVATVVDTSTHIYLLIGQSNMEGVPGPGLQDVVTNPRVRVLAYDNCPDLGRTYNQWYSARPPLHSCRFGVGPGDEFARIMSAAFPQATIGLVPTAISGASMDLLSKGAIDPQRSLFIIPPDNQAPGAYGWIVERARLAQQSGTIRGILFHQGESSLEDPRWLERVATLIADLRADLGLGDVPFIAGELASCCTLQNPKIRQLPSRIPNAHVVSSEGLTTLDNVHFDLVSQRELGKRYGQKMIELLRN
jgi:hypothetical protein